MSGLHVLGKLVDARMCVADSSAFCRLSSEAKRVGLMSGSNVSVVSALFLLVYVRVFSADISMPRIVSRRRRVDLRLPSDSTADVGGSEAEDSRAGVAGGSGLIGIRLAADVGGSSDNSSTPDATEALRVPV